MKVYLFLYVVLAVLYISVVNGKVPTTQEKLYHDLLTDYNKLELPVEDVQQPLNITVTFELVKVFKLSAKKQKIAVVFVLTQVWEDRYLKWNTSHYNDFDTISIPPSNIWIPDLGVYNEIINKDHQKTDISVKVMVNSNGTCRWSVPMFLHAFCHVDVTYLPLDIQYCKLQLGSLAYTASELRIIHSIIVKSSSFLKNGEWTLFKQNITTTYSWDPIRLDYFDIVEVTLRIQRSSIYYILEIFAPCILISGLTILGFLLPPESGERMSLGMLILLSMTFFQQLTMKMFPLQEFPLISKYFLVSLIEIGLALLVTTITINLYYCKDRRMPNLMKTIVHEYMGKITRIHPAVEVKRKKKRSFRSNLTSTGMTFEMQLESMSNPQADAVNEQLSDSSIGLLSFKHENESRLEPQGGAGPLIREDTPEEWAKDWKLAAKIIDRFAMYASFVIGFITILTIFLQSPIFRGDYTHYEG